MIVVKVGGGAGVDLDAVCADVAALQKMNPSEPIIVVHGTSDAANTLAQRLNVPARTIQSPSGYVSRYTDPATLEVFTMAAIGQVNVALVGKLQALGVNAIGLSGADGRLMRAKRKDAIRAIDPDTGKQRMIRDDYTGKIETINGDLLRLLVSNGYTPVIAPLAMGEQSEPLNVDGDRAAAMVAGAVGAATLIILTNVPGLMAHFPDESSVIPHIAAADIERAIDIAGGRMKKKVLAAQEALALGVLRVVLGDSRRADPIQAAAGGAGTVIGAPLPISQR
jgi:acetylglutamate/LysW-gamma-L-alpha-aminoadipate kinase